MYHLNILIYFNHEYNILFFFEQKNKENQLNLDDEDLEKID